MPFFRNLLAVTLLAVILGTVVSVGGATPAVRAGQAPAGPGANARLQMYEAIVDGATAAKLVEQGFDVVQTEQVKGGVRVVLVLYPWQKNARREARRRPRTLDQHRRGDRDQAGRAAEGRGLQGLASLRRAERAFAPTSTRLLPPTRTCSSSR